MDLIWNRESKLISLIYQIHRLGLEPECDDSNSKIILSLITQTISLVRSIDFDSRPQSELMSLINQADYLLYTMDLDSQPDPLSKLQSLILQKVWSDNSKEPGSEPDSGSHSEPDLEPASEFMLLIRESFSLQPQPEFISLIHQIYSLVISMANIKLETKLISLITELISPRMYFSLDICLISRIISLVSSIVFDSQPLSELMSLTKQAVCLFHSMNLDDQPDPLRKLISLFSQKISEVKTARNLKRERDQRVENMVEYDGKETEKIVAQHNFRNHYRFKPRHRFGHDVDSDTKFLDLDSNPDTDSDTEFLEVVLNVDGDSETKLLELDPNSNTDYLELDNRDSDTELDDRDSDTKCLELDSNADRDSDTKFLDLDLNSDTDSVKEFLKVVPNADRDSDLMSLVSQTLSVEPELEFISLIYQIFSLVTSMNSKWKKLIFLCPQVQVELGKENFHAINEEVSCSSNDKWKCLPFNWKTFGLTKEDVTHIRCPTCNGENHGEYEKAPLEIKHTLHPNHSLELVLLKGDRTRECYCCDRDLEEVFYFCSACDFAMNTTCVEKPRVLSVEHPKWHEHTLAQFPRKTSLTCNVCALTHSGCPFYICPPCDFVVHQKCLSLPRVIRISRHFHRIYFTPSFDQGVRYCGVCRRKIDNDYGGYSCNKDGCSYAVHSKCATQRNVWDGKELEGEPEENIKDVEPFVTVRDGIIRHFSHQHHHLKLDENTGRDYDENKLCQACITPIYFVNFYLCMQCDFLLHEECAKLSRKMHHPIHPHLLTLVGRSDHLVMDATKLCSVCPWRCTAGFFYECSQRQCRFKVHVQCATISEPLVHGSHKNPLFLTSKPGEDRRCGVCKELGHCSTTETFNCIECDFALCFKCATLPQKLRYKHDKHTLTLSYGDETSTMTYWCEVCEKKVNPKKRFYTCDDYCCDTIHIECMLGVDFYMKPDSFWLYYNTKVGVLPNNHHMVRPICSFCGKRCPHKIVFRYFGLIMCSTSCVIKSREVTK